jgi:polysaccharide pyruvyl transferase WcaK-like protein
MIYRIVKGTRAVPDLILGFFAELKCLVASLRYLRGTDLLFVTGSGVLSDHFGGPANFPYTFFKWAVLARVARVPLAFVSVGAGPLQHRPSRRLIRYALKLAAYRSCRDVTSKKILDDLGLPGQTLVFPDLANGLYVEPVAARARDGSPVVGVNVFPHYDLRYSPIGDVGRYQRYLTTLASFVAWLIRQNYRIVLFSTQIRADGLAIRDFKELLKTSHGADMEGLVLEFRINDVADLTYCLATMDLVVATRFHGILLSLLMNRPVLALSNHHKMTDLMIDVGQGAYVFDIATMCAESLVERFKDLESNSGKVRREISERMGGYRRALEEQYDVVLGLADGARSVRNCSAGRAPVRPPVVDGNGGPGLYYPGAGGS